MKRKTLSKKIRFEVFKRDKFTCQYCGRMAPDVILEVDHLKPVVDGGDNDIMNLVTSCFDCNRGKGKRKLDNQEELKIQRKRLVELSERREQIEMMNEWKRELLELKNQEVGMIADYINGLTEEWEVSESGKRTIRKYLGQFTFEEIIAAADIAFERYYWGSSNSWNEAFRKIGGICYNRRNDGDL